MPPVTPPAVTGGQDTGKASGGSTGGGVGVTPGSPNQGSSSSNDGGTPNTTSGSVAGLNDMYGPSFSNDIGYDDTIRNNIQTLQPTDFKGVNPTYLPGQTNDKTANLKMKDDFGFKGVSLDTMYGKYDIKLGKQFSKDMKKGEVQKKAKIKHASLHPNRHKNSSRITNTVHSDGIARGGVSFDSSFKSGKGGDPFTVKTS